MAMKVSRSVLGAPDQELEVVETPDQDLDRTTSGATETSWQSSDWSKYNGYYRKNQGGTKAAIDKFSIWTVGKGFQADERTTKILSKIIGMGKDSFNSVMKNQVRVKKINGDSYAEIITTDGKFISENGDNFANLKPLNGGAVKTVTDKKGMLIRYEQTNPNTKEVIDTFEPEELFHLINDREGDEIHGISIYESMTDSLDNIQQLDDDMKVVFHRYVMPLMIFKLQTDDPTEIAAIKATGDEAINKGKNLYVPKDAVDPETFQIPQYSTLDPLKWRQEWKQDSIKDLGVPEIVLGRAVDITEASSKIVYLSFQQTIEDEQLFIEEQVKLQLHLEIKYEFPARIEENLGEDERKDGDYTIKPEENKVNMEGKK